MRISIRAFVLLILAVLPVEAPAQNVPADKPRLPGISTQDDRLPVDYRAMPWRAIGKVQTNLANSCTGVLVGPRHVLTAGHCLYNPRTQRLLQALSLHFLAGYDRGGYEAHAKIVSVAHSQDLERLLREGKVGFPEDWAILTLDQNLGHRFGTLAVAPRQVSAGVPIKAVGYSMDKRHILTGDLNCKVLKPSEPLRDPRILHDCQITFGNSGGPLLVEQTGITYIAGVNIAIGRRRTGEWTGMAVDVSGLRERIATLK